jgi:hypothetical protein
MSASNAFRTSGVSGLVPRQTMNLMVDRHSRAGGNPEYRKLDSRLRGNDKPLLPALTSH